MSLLTDVISHVRATLPGSSSRYPDDDISEMLVHVDRLAKEYVGVILDEVDIPMKSGVLYYDLPTTAVAVVSCSVSTTGEEPFDDGMLDATDVREISERVRRWRQSRANQPDCYCLFSSPGLPASGGPDGLGYSKIMFWPASDASEPPTIRVRYQAAFSDLSVISQGPDRWLLENIYIPGVMAQIWAFESQAKFKSSWDTFMYGLDLYRARSAASRGAHTFQVGEGDTLL